MSEGHVQADAAGLQRMATELAKSTSAVEDTTHSVPPMPQVTTSNGKVGFTLGETLKALAALIEATYDTASKIHASNGSYGDTDNHAEIIVNQSGHGLK